MKIGRTSDTRTTSGAKKTKKSQGGFGDLVSGDTQKSSGTSAPHALTDVGALLSVQAVGQEAAKDALDHSREILSALTELQLETLSGKNTALQKLVKLANEECDKSCDEALQSTIDEIDLRAAVELAKSKKTT